jgi:Uma2 family endonuclease
MSIAMEDWPRRHRITVEEYHRMAEVGLLAPDARVELIDGVIIDIPPMTSRHAATVSQLGELLHSGLAGRATISCHGPLQLGDLSEPLLDFVLLTRREDFYTERHPIASDTLLAIEVSDTTLRYDLHTKMPLYARHGIPELWVVDVEGKQLHVFRNPAGVTYSEVITSDKPGAIPISALPGTTVDLSSLFRR